MSSTKVRKRFAFFGDSICVGQGVSIHKGWVPRLAAHIDAVSAILGFDVVVLNASVNGNTTRQALERMPYDIQSHGVDWMIVQFGLNDCNFWESDRGVPRVSPRAFAANLEEIVERGVRFGARRIILNTNHPTTRNSVVQTDYRVTYEDNNRRYNELIREVVESRPQEVILNDVERHCDELIASGRIACLDALLLQDGLHLSEAGHDIYYKMLEPKVDAILEAKH